MPSILLIKAIAAALILAALTAAGWALERHIEGLGAAKQYTVDNAALTKQKVAAARLLADATIDKDRAEKALADFKNTQEVKDATNQKDSAAQAGRLAALAVAGRLRDPNQAGGCGSGSGGTSAPTATASNSGPNDTSVPGGLLSAQLSGLLQRLSGEADELNIAYASCRADAASIRATVNK